MLGAAEGGEADVGQDVGSVRTGDEGPDAVVVSMSLVSVVAGSLCPSCPSCPSAALAVSLARGLTWVDRDCLAVADLEPAREHLAVGLEPQSARRHANPGFCAALVRIEVGLTG